MVRKVLLVVVLIFVMFSFAGCHTVQGLGHDITSVGEAAEEILGGL